MQYKENKHEQSKLSGAGTEIAFKIKWHFSKSLPFLADSVTPRLIHSNLGRRKINDTNNEDSNSNTAYPKRTPNTVSVYLLSHKLFIIQEKVLFLKTTPARTLSGKKSRGKVTKFFAND